MDRSRRQVLAELALTASWIALPLGCATPAPCPSLPGSHEQRGLTDADLRIIASPGDEALSIVQRSTPAGVVLRRAARPLSASDDVTRLQKRMRSSLEVSKGVGIAAPQVGVGVRAILVMHDARPPAPDQPAKPHVEWYLNPRIIERSDDVSLDYEGCLSVPDVCGLVRRSKRVVVEHGLPSALRTLEVAGFNARIFQHEIDHLDGVLYVDRVEGSLQPKEKLKELRQQLREQHPELAFVSTAQVSMRM